MSIDQLNRTFAALADPTRRAILARLASGEASVTELAEPFAMSLPAVSKHLKVLERAGLITRGREAQWRPCRIEVEPLREVADWVEEYRRLWEQRFDRLDDYLRELQTKGETVTRNINSPATVQGEREIVITRLFDAPRDLVFRVWTDPNHVVHWWGPNGFTNTNHEMDVRPGGVWRFVMHGPDGVDYENKVVYHEVVAPERLVYTLGGAEGDEGQFEVTVTFTELGDKTSITMQALFGSAAERDQVTKEYGALDGANQSFDRLAQYLANL